MLVGLAGFPAIWSNLVATALGTVPSFELNRRWVWSQCGPRSLGRQALPYCTLSFAGLVLSTLAVHFAADATVSSTRLVHTAAVELGNFGSYGLLWACSFCFATASCSGSADPGRQHGPGPYPWAYPRLKLPRPPTRYSPVRAQHHRQSNAAIGISRPNPLLANQRP